MADQYEFSQTHGKWSFAIYIFATVHTYVCLTLLGDISTPQFSREIPISRLNVSFYSRKYFRDMYSTVNVYRLKHIFCFIFLQYLQETAAHAWDILKEITLWKLRIVERYRIWEDVTRWIIAFRERNRRSRNRRAKRLFFNATMLPFIQLSL